jgi:hypothetical protein
MPSTTAWISWPISRTSGAGDALGPGELGDVDEAFDAGFEFHEGAVGHELGDLALDLVGRPGTCASMFSQGFLELLEAEGNALLLAVDVEDDCTSSFWPMASSSLGWLRRPQLMSVMWSRPSMP